jgi:hypothetical protein
MAVRQRRTQSRIDTATNPTAGAHFVLRIPLVTKAHGRSFNTVEAHNQAIQLSGRVAMAKFGDPGTRTRYEKIKNQIDDNVETLLILVSKQGDRFFGFQSRLSSIHYGKPNAQIISIAPDYYRAEEWPGRLWFIVSSPFLSCALEGLCLSTNHRPLLDVVRECRTASMLVEKCA